MRELSGVTVIHIVAAALAAAALLWLFLHTRRASAGPSDPAMELCAALLADAAHIRENCAGTLTLRPGLRAIRARFVFFAPEDVNGAPSKLFGPDYKPRSLAFSQLPDDLRPDGHGGLAMDYRLACVVSPHRRAAFLAALRERCAAQHPELSPTLARGSLTVAFGK